jgi:hypothetical protein
VALPKPLRTAAWVALGAALGVGVAADLTGSYLLVCWLAGI